MKKIFTLVFIYTFANLQIRIFAQTPTNMICTNPTAEQIMLGNFNPDNYKPATIINLPGDIVNGLANEISTDSLLNYLVKLSSFHNRNTYSDTVSNTIGIGAARRWVYSKFQKFSADNENRLLTSYLQFNIDASGFCGSGQFRDIFAVLPGTDTSLKDIIILEGHVDSRCENNCDVTCKAHGMEDNGSGTSLVMELARVMSKYTFSRTIVFIVTVGEEQGLYGADAFARYCIAKGIKIRSVQNNDIDGGIYCGKTASPPTDCIVEGQMDSTHYRIFSYGGYSQPHKSLARFIKLQYLEEILPIETVPMTINIMTPEDRSGRGGDHIPFREQGFTSVRLTSAHEHGDASNGTGYTDRQHTSRDTLGADTNSDGSIDSFFVDFNYLRRNTLINGNAAAMSALGPKTPVFSLDNDSTNGLTITITAEQQYNHFRVSVRRNSSNHDLDLLYEFNDSLHFIIPAVKKDSLYYISVASMDSNNIESLFTTEKFAKAVGNSTNTSIKENIFAGEEINLIAVPNPSKYFTTFKLKIKKTIPYHQGEILVTDVTGKTVAQLLINTGKSDHEIIFQHQHLPAGIYNYSLSVDGKNSGNTGRLVIFK